MKDHRQDPNTISAAGLRAVVRGRVITPADADYDEARQLFYGWFDRRPALIVRAANVEDVARVVGVARETGTELAVRSGGHSIAGHSGTDGGIVLDLSAMKEMSIDVQNRTAWAEAGLTAGEYTDLAAEHGLATGFGDTGSVGLGGITVGGGVGYLVRKYGLTIDSLLGADVVTADGRLLRADAETNPDLFWAIRGGGGNFGVVTRFHFRLHEVGTVVGGMLLLPATVDTVHSFLAEAEAAPEELSVIANVMRVPPMPFVPAEYHGQPGIMGVMVYAGDVEAGQRAVAPFRAIAKPIADMLQPMPYPKIYDEGEGGPHPAAGAIRSFFLDSFARSEAEAVVDYLRASTASMAVAQLRVLGGAMARVPVDATAFAHRNRRIMVNVAALYERPEETPAHESWATSFALALRPVDAGVYVNFLGDEGAERVRDAYPGATWDRLAAIKRRYDPDNVFRHNHNIRSTGDASAQAA